MFIRISISKLSPTLWFVSIYRERKPKKKLTKRRKTGLIENDADNSCDESRKKIVGKRKRCLPTSVAGVEGSSCVLVPEPSEMF